MSVRGTISPLQYVWMVIIYIIGSSAIVFIGGNAEQDVWLAICLGLLESMALSFPFLVLATSFPGMGVSQINDVVWGKWLGNAFTLAFIWYTLSLASIVGSDFQEFIKAALLREMPEPMMDAVNIITLVAFTLYGIETIGRYTSIIVPFVVSLILGVTALSLPYMDFNNIRPTFVSWPEIPVASHGLATFPFGEVVAFAAVIPSLNRPKKAIRFTFIGMALGASLLLIMNVRNVLLLGNASSFFTYASYSASKIINLGGVFTRMETIIAVNHTLASFIKAGILVYVTCVTTADMLRIKSAWSVAIPIVLLVSFLDHHNFPSVAHNLLYSERVYPFYALPFQVGIPLLTLSAAFLLKRLPPIQTNRGKNPTVASETIELPEDLR